MKASLAWVLVLGCSLLAACEKPDPTFVQGYVEGDFVYIAAPFGAQLKSLSVERGNGVKKDAPLFALDDAVQRATREESNRRVAQARAQLEDSKSGERPTEIAALRAQLSQASAALALSEQELARQEQLLERKVLSQRDYDAARAQRAQAAQKVQELTANIATAELGSREEQIAAAAENLKAQEAALVSAEWSLAQMSQSAPVDSLVSDVLFRQGDWVGPNQPVIELLPPANVKVRAFVSQSVLGQIQLGAVANILVDGVPSAYQGRVSFISPRAEYTPPVIYSQEMRQKFVYLVELSLAPEVAARLHPGQPVDVKFSLGAR